MVFNNLVKGLDKLHVPYRLNNFRFIKKNPTEVACIIGRDQVLFERKWTNPIVFGSAFGINPITNPTILTDYPVKKIVVPGAWVKEFFAPYGADNVAVWPVGIDTEEWQPALGEKQYDFLIYNKIRWHHEQMDAELTEPIKQYLRKNNLSFLEITYGNYTPPELKEKIALCRSAIFLCEHETQGIAYQQILSSGLPILAWDRGGYWQDPYWYPEKIKFKPVTSVPYWDERCGLKFDSIAEFGDKLTEFTMKVKENLFQPRAYVLQNLTLEKCAADYIDIVNTVKRNG